MLSLTDSLQLRHLKLSNRNVHSAMTRNRATGNVPNHHNVEYYTQRVRGGAALIVTEGTLVTQQGTEWPNAPGIWNSEQVAAWRQVVESVHNAGGIIFCQLWHVGRLSHPDMPEQISSGEPVYAPSKIAARGGKFRILPETPGYVTPTAIDDPRKLIFAYRDAAENAKRAGFDGVELHAGNGYLPHQFLDRCSNQRSDEWGGSAQNRTRFVIEVIQALVEVWGCDKVGIKLSPAGGLNDMGMPLEDSIETYSYLCQELDRHKILYFTLVRYVESQSPVIDPDGRRRGTPLDVLSLFRPLIKNAFVFLNAGLSVAEAEELLRSGLIDAVVFARLWISHPDLQLRIMHHNPVDTPINWRTVNGNPDIDPRIGYTDYPFWNTPSPMMN